MSGRLLAGQFSDHQVHTGCLPCGRLCDLAVRKQFLCVDVQGLPASPLLLWSSTLLWGMVSATLLCTDREARRTLVLEEHGTLLHIAITTASTSVILHLHLNHQLVSLNRLNPPTHTQHPQPVVYLQVVPDDAWGKTWTNHGVSRLVHGKVPWEKQHVDRTPCHRYHKTRPTLQNLKLFIVTEKNIVVGRWRYSPGGWSAQFCLGNGLKAGCQQRLLSQTQSVAADPRLRLIQSDTWNNWDTILSWIQ